MIDLKGKLYGDWKIIEDGPRTSSGIIKWLCECKCGKKEYIRSTQITGNRARKNCGCEKDWSGFKFGKLTVIKKVSGLGNHASKHLCKCDCGRDHIAWGGSLHSGGVKSCGCIRSKTDEEKCLVISYGHYKKRAEKSNLKFEIKLEEFKKIIFQPCVYCGEIESNTTKRKMMDRTIKLNHNGIDRVDNDKGYILENCVSCCKICNLMKRDLSYNQWMEKMKKILNYQQQQPTGVL